MLPLPLLLMYKLFSDRFECVYVCAHGAFRLFIRGPRRNDEPPPPLPHRYNVHNERPEINGRVPAHCQPVFFVMYHCVSSGGRSQDEPPLVLLAWGSDPTNLATHSLTILVFSRWGFSPPLARRPLEE